MQIADVFLDAAISPLTNLVTGFGLSPGDGTAWNPQRLRSTDVEFTTLEPLDHVVRTVRFDAVRLADYELTLEPR